MKPVMRKSLAGFAFCTQEGDIEPRRYTKRYTNFVAALLMLRQWKAARGEPAVQLPESHVRMT